MNKIENFNEQAQVIEQSFCRALKIVVNTLTGCEPEYSDSFCPDEFIVTGAMLVQGEYNMLVTLSSTKKSATQIISYMTGISAEYIKDEDISDGIPELVNMVCGTAKASLLNEGFSLSLTIPFLIAGTSFEIINKANTTKISKTFILEKYIEIKLEILKL